MKAIIVEKYVNYLKKDGLSDIEIYIQLANNSWEEIVKFCDKYLD